MMWQHPTSIARAATAKPLTSMPQTLLLYSLRMLINNQSAKMHANTQPPFLHTCFNEHSFQFPWT